MPISIEADPTLAQGYLKVNGVTAATVTSTGITANSLVSSVQQSLIPAGAVMPFAMNSAPSGWLAADGTEYSKTGTYAALFAAIGTTHGETNGSGGAGTSHFRVPDLRGYFVRGSGINSDLTQSGAFGVKQTDELKAHTHTVSDECSTQGLIGAAGSNRLVVDGVETRTTSSTGGTETRPKNIALLYCIKH